MDGNGINERDVQAAIEALRTQVMQLNDRVTKVEQASHVHPDAPLAVTDSKCDSNDELVCVITAAIAAYLGVKPHIRQIRLAGGASWAQQGRVAIQASHGLSIRHE